mgnify:FL=1
MLIQRYADRLEAIGVIGLWRCYQYTRETKAPFSTSQTLRAISQTELYEKVATVERYRDYKGKSASMMDHMYDKLLRLHEFPIQNTYLLTTALSRVQPLVQFALEFWTYRKSG